MKKSVLNSAAEETTAGRARTAKRKTARLTRRRRDHPSTRRERTENLARRMANHVARGKDSEAAEEAKAEAEAKAETAVKAATTLMAATAAEEEVPDVAARETAMASVESLRTGKTARSMLRRVDTTHGKARKAARMGPFKTGTPDQHAQSHQASNSQREREEAAAEAKETPGLRDSRETTRMTEATEMVGDHTVAAEVAVVAEVAAVAEAPEVETLVPLQATQPTRQSKPKIDNSED